jgi:hypothetical protein
MQSTFSQLNFPERHVKVGESFSQETSLSIPIGDKTVELIITTNYKLLSITNDMADIDISQIYTMKTKVTKYPINATGSGKGKMLYDTANNNFLKYQTDTEMEMSMKMDNFNLDLKTKSGFIQTTEITKNASR